MKSVFLIALCLAVFGCKEKVEPPKKYCGKTPIYRAKFAAEDCVEYPVPSFYKNVCPGYGKINTVREVESCELSYLIHSDVYSECTYISFDESELKPSTKCSKRKRK